RLHRAHPLREVRGGVRKPDPPIRRGRKRVLVGLLGHHIGYSASPAMQNAAFRAAGLDDWSYELFDVAPEELPQAVSALRLRGRADLVINCTPLGRDEEAVLDPGDLPRKAVIDLVYVRGGTPLIAAARARGLAVADGWTVLLHQGAASFTAWTGRPAPVEAMRAALG